VAKCLERGRNGAIGDVVIATRSSDQLRLTFVDEAYATVQIGQAKRNAGSMEEAFRRAVRFGSLAPACVAQER